MSSATIKPGDICQECAAHHAPGKIWGYNLLRKFRPFADLAQWLGRWIDRHYNVFNEDISPMTRLHWESRTTECLWHYHKMLYIGRALTRFGNVGRESFRVWLKNLFRHKPTLEEINAELRRKWAAEGGRAQ